MANINFVPTDYNQKRDSTRANIIYLFLFAAVMGGIGATFSIIRMRQKTINSELAAVNKKLTEATEKFKLLEQLQQTGDEMMKTAAMTSELFESVPKSTILACLTNSLPKGVSFTNIKLFQKTIKSPQPAKGSSQYKKAAKRDRDTVSKEKMIETFIEIKGIAPSDIEVAGYIAQLGKSIMLESTQLVESRQVEIDKVNCREFKLTSKIKRNLQLTKEDIDSLKVQHGIAKWTE
jgi:Tfp pilus assembly protein PilN